MANNVTSFFLSDLLLRNVYTEGGNIFCGVYSRTNVESIIPCVSCFVSKSKQFYELAIK